ncbi:retrovirus-related pol polyprotein from transposon TNT 1-94, partial [Trifolium medium]|nr:retrovirus-related pol polyprotein from transposon TNT 1-94 [Trifolium medium]
SKPASTPLDPAIKLHIDDSKPYIDVSQYRRLIGKLLYLTNTRPDISFATQQLSQFLHKPTVTHYNAACRVIRYLKHNPGRGIMFPRNSDLQILGFSDSDWAGCLDTIQKNQLVATVSSLAHLLYHGRLRNRPLCQDHPQRLSTELCQVQHVN